MKSINIENAEKNLYKIIETANKTHEPISITGEHSSAVLIGEDDWKSIEETLHLQSVPGMRDSIIDGMNTPLSELETAANESMNDIKNGKFYNDSIENHIRRITEVEE